MSRPDLKRVSSSGDTLPDTQGRMVRLTRVGGKVWVRSLCYAFPLELVESIMFRQVGDCLVTLTNGKVIALSFRETDYLKSYFGG